LSNRDRQPLGYGLIGCGAFGLFCLEQYAAMSEVRLVAAADASPAAARRAEAAFELDACESAEELLRRSDVDIVHIAAPPVSHVALVTQALAAGKHVLCEKPLATNLDDARAMVGRARRAKRLLAVNLIMRYNPLCQAVDLIIKKGLLGEPLHGFFENYAKDEPLGPDHWFWDRDKSGGIFIEHGVHFFDLVEWWLGPGVVLASQESKRPGTDLVEHVNCTIAYGDGVLFNFYHGFHQTTRMDRQELRIVFERGSLALTEWVPTRLTIDAIVDDAALEMLQDIMPAAEVETVATYRGNERLCTSRHKPYAVDRRVVVSCGAGMSKQELYAHVLRALLADQVAAVRNSSHQRRVNESNGISSLETAVAADRLARETCGV